MFKTKCGQLAEAEVVAKAETAVVDQLESSKTFPYPRELAGPEIVDFAGLSGPLLPQNPMEKVGGFAPYFFQWDLRWEGAAQTPKAYDFLPGGTNYCVT